MPAKKDLAVIANRIRDLVSSEPKDETFTVAVWRLVRRAIGLGAFGDVRFTEFVAFFEPQRESETYNTRRAVLSCQSVTPDLISRLPLTMLEATKWLTDNGARLELSMPKSLPTFDDFQSVRVGAGNGFRFSIRYPSRAVLRPHVEFLAMLVEGKRLTRRRTKPKGTAGAPRIEGKKEEARLKRFDDWQAAKAAGISKKEFCKTTAAINELDGIIDWVAKRKLRGQI